MRAQFPIRSENDDGKSAVYLKKLEQMAKENAKLKQELANMTQKRDALYYTFTQFSKGLFFGAGNSILQRCTPIVFMVKSIGQILSGNPAPQMTLLENKAVRACVPVCDKINAEANGNGSGSGGAAAMSSSNVAAKSRLTQNGPAAAGGKGTAALTLSSTDIRSKPIAAAASDVDMSSSRGGVLPHSAGVKTPALYPTNG